MIFDLKLDSENLIMHINNSKSTFILSQNIIHLYFTKTKNIFKISHKQILNILIFIRSYFS